MQEGEKRLRQEDCNEDMLGVGILTLTNKRIVFDKTKSRIMDFSKHMGNTILDVPLDSIAKTWKEGWLMKKVCFSSKAQHDSGEEQTFKFGVFGTGSWLESINDAIDDNKHSEDSSNNGT